MSRLKTLLVAFAISTTGIMSASLVAPAAEAQSLLVVDAQDVIDQSQGAVYITQTLATMREANVSGLQAEASALESEGASLQARIGNRTPEQVQQDPQLNAALEAYGRKLQAFNDKTVVRNQEVLTTGSIAEAELSQTLYSIIEQIRVERGAQIVQSRRTTFAYDPAIDITADVLARLDQQMPTVPMPRKTFTEEEKQQVLAAVQQRQAQQTLQLARQAESQQAAYGRVVSAAQQAQQQQGQ